MPAKILLTSIVILGLIVLFFFPIVEKYNYLDNRVYKTCRFVHDHIYPIEKNMNEWLQMCRVRSRQLLSRTQNQKLLFEQSNDILSELNVSHLELFSPEASEHMWNDTNLENGIESQFVEGELIITRVFPGSEALKKDLRRGDRVILAADESMSPSELNQWKGPLKFGRNSRVLSVDLDPKMLTINRELVVSDVDGVKVLSVESFRSKFFETDMLDAVFSKIKSTDILVLDFRKNNGGNFVAGLRLLSAFICEPTVVGYMKKKPNLGTTSFFKNDLDSEYQIHTLEQFDSIALKTFPVSRCLPKPRAVLVDALSKSTTEWVTLAFRDFLEVPILGATTAGELVVGIWYDVAHIWGSKVELSVPSANYESVKGYRIEGHGVPVDQVIYPRRADFERGLDSEVWQIVQKIKNSL